jgi:hypothetical protein
MMGADMYQLRVSDDLGATWRDVVPVFSVRVAREAAFCYAAGHRDAHADSQDAAIGFLAPALVFELVKDGISRAIAPLELPRNARDVWECDDPAAVVVS